MYGAAVSSMNVKEETICRLCLKLAEIDFQVIDEIIREMFEVLLLTLNLEISNDPVICKDCAEVTKKCFNFKSVCINTDTIFSFAIKKSRVAIESEDLYDVKHIEAVNDNFICRFCSNHLSGSNFFSLDTLMNDVTFLDMLQKLMPEMDFDTKNHIICTFCRHDLECYFKFAKNCFDVEEKINKYFQNEGTLSGQVKLSEIQSIPFKNILESDYTQMYEIKQEEGTLETIGEARPQVYDDELIKSEVLDIKDEEFNFGDTNCEFLIWETEIENFYQTKYKGEFYKKTNQIVNAWYLHTKNGLEAHFQCTMCTYQTKIKRNFQRHELIHKDIKDVEVYKCSVCTFETKYKASLRKHTLIHKDSTEVEMYKCSICTFQTKIKINLKYHMLVHKDITEVEMYKCRMCDFKTKFKGSLRGHMLIHRDFTQLEMFKCSMCTFETKRKGSLKNHMLIHKDITEVEMHKCSICSFKTKQKCGLKGHMLIHKDITEVKMYKCSMCTFKTKYRGSLKTHVLTHEYIIEID